VKLKKLEKLTAKMEMTRRSRKQDLQVALVRRYTMKICEAAFVVILICNGINLNEI
jgi:hypothetical protein